MRLQFAILDRHDHLLVVALNHVTVVEHPFASALGFVVLELALEVGPVGVGPPASHKPVFAPLANVLHAGGREDVGALSVFFSIMPLAGVDIFVGVDEHPLPFFFSRPPLAIILALIGIDHSSNSIFQIIFELPCVYITIGVGVLALSAPQLNDRCYTPSLY